MKRTTIAVAALLLAGCAAPAAAPEPAPTVTVTEQAPAPEPEPTVDQATVQLAALELTWQDMDADTREGMCLVYNLDADMAWDAFHEGDADGNFERSTFDEFFGGKC